MSLFDVIKYPVSDIPTGDEMLALPPTIFLDWMDWVRDNCNRPWYTTTSGAEKLRKMLAEYDVQGDGT